jgi:hypothetical protein
MSGVKTGEGRRETNVPRNSSLYSQWGLIPKITLARESLGAVRIGNTHNKMVVDPTVK